MFNVVKKQFEVGDIIVTKNFTGTYKRIVTRVTKTQAICDVKRSDGTGYAAKFRRGYDLYPNGGAHVTPNPYIEWDMNEYSVIAKDKVI
jgi:hypothetical protein